MMMRSEGAVAQPLRSVARRARLGSDLVSDLANLGFLFSDLFRDLLPRLLAQPHLRHPIDEPRDEGRETSKEA